MTARQFKGVGRAVAMTTAPFVVARALRTVLPLAALTFGLIPALPAKADPTPSATINMDVLGGATPQVNASVSSSTSSVSLEETVGTASFAGHAYGGDSPSVSIQMSGASTGDYRYGAGGQIVMIYYYKLDSSSSQLAPATFSFSSHTEEHAEGSAFYDYTGDLAIATQESYIVYTLERSSLWPSSGDLLGDHSKSNYIHTNTWYDVSMQFDGGASAKEDGFYGLPYGGGSASVSAFIGPVTITVDPTWLAANPGSHLEFATLTAVPELSTWAMMLLGFCGLGFAGFRKAKGFAAA